MSSATSTSSDDKQEVVMDDDNNYTNDELDDSNSSTTVEPVIHIKPSAMNRLQELRMKQQVDTLVLRMGVRNGGCSGLSYVMDFATQADVTDDDVVDEYTEAGIACIVDSKSLLYLYGLELDYSDALIGGGFKFFNPNAQDSCGCGSSFGV